MIQPKRMFCLGLSHHTAPVDIRGQLIFTPKSVDEALQRVKHSARFSEFAILSTCNRVEFYACTPEQDDADVFSLLLDFIVEMRNCDTDALEGYLYRHEGVAAAKHLCRVASGLDSMVLGESQILGQVGTALNTSAAHTLAGPVLTALFQTAIKAGKRARVETAVNRNSASVSSVAVQLAKRVVGDLSGMRAAVIGTGEMGRLAVKALKSHGLKTLTIVNRNYATALHLAEQVGCEAAPLEQITEVLAASDVVISATGAEDIVIDAQTVEDAMRERQGRPLAIIDVALPRNVDPSVAALSKVHLFDIDQLQTQIEASLHERKKEIPRVEAIIAEELERFSVWLCEATVEPVISDLRRKAEAIRRQELERALHTMQPLDEKSIEQLQFFSRALVNKLLHDPTIRLREEAVNGEAARYADLVRFLFAL